MPEVRESSAALRSVAVRPASAVRSRGNSLSRKRLVSDHQTTTGGLSAKSRSFRVARLLAGHREPCNMASELPILIQGEKPTWAGVSELP